MRKKMSLGGIIVIVIAIMLAVRLFTAVGSNVKNKKSQTKEEIYMICYQLEQGETLGDGINTIELRYKTEYDQVHLYNVEWNEDAQSFELTFNADGHYVYGIVREA